MNPHLLQSLERLTEYYRSDPRCLGLYLLGSIGRGATDEYSDVDLAVVVDDASYAVVSGGMRAVCERCCGPIVVWLPEGETDGFCNYAFLFGAPDGQVLLYDFEIVTESVFKKTGMRPDTVLYDPVGLLAQAARTEAAPASDPRHLARCVDTYWVYAYLNGKYRRRGDVFKMLSVQNVMFQMHMEMLRALHPGVPRTWWGEDVRRFSPERQKDMLLYFGSVSLPDICAAIERELAVFVEDAGAVCQANGFEYPQALDGAVRKHLTEMGVLRDVE